MFDPDAPPDPAELDRAVKAVVRDCLGVREGEEVLVICNPATLGLGERLRGEAGRAGADAVLAVMAERDSHAAEPPGDGRRGDGAPPTSSSRRRSSRSRTPPRARRRSEAGARIATLPGVTEEMLARVMSADMDELRRRGRRDRRRCSTRGREARITCAERQRPAARARGPDRDPRRRRADRAAAPSATCPAARASSRPIEGTGEGTLVVDGSIAGVGIPAEPVRADRRGRPPRPTRPAPRARALIELLTAARRRTARNVAELGDRHQREGDPDRQRARGREDPRHRPRRLRRLGGDRRHGPGPGPPRLRRAEADGRRRRRDELVRDGELLV